MAVFGTDTLPKELLRSSEVLPCSDENGPLRLEPNGSEDVDGRTKEDF